VQYGIAREKKISSANTQTVTGLQCARQFSVSGKASPSNGKNVKAKRARNHC